MCPTILNPPALDLALASALQLHRAGRTQEAQQAYEQILRDQPANPDALNLLGLLHRQQGRGEQAVGLMTRALELSPGNTEYLNNLGQTWAALARHGQALDAFRRSLEIDPQQMGTRLLMAKANKELGRIGVAVGLLRDVLSVAPEFPGGFALLVACVEEAVWRGGDLGAAVRGDSREPNVQAHGLAGGAISVIICSVDEGKFAAVSDSYRRLLAGEPHEIIRVFDARSLCEGYNRGFRQSGGDLLVFSHDDIDILSLDFAVKLRRYLGRYDVVGVAGTDRLAGASWGAAGWPHLHGLVPHLDSRNGQYTVCAYGLDAPTVGGIQALDGLFLAARREVVSAVGFDEASFDGFHLYDLDFTFSAYLAGFKLAVCNDLTIAHHSGGNYDAAWRKYAEVFLGKHGSRLASTRGGAASWPVAKFGSRTQARLFCEELARVTAGLGGAIKPAPPSPFSLSFYLPRKPEAAENLPRAVALHQAGKLAEAAALYERVLLASPNNAEALNLLGLLRYQQGQPDQAVELLEKAVSLGGAAAEVHNNLGMAYRAQGKLPQAREQYRRGLELAPRHQGLLYNLGNSSQEMGQVEEAERWYAKALSLDPNFVEAHYNRGNALRALGRLGEAIASYEQAIAREPFHAGAWNNLGNAQLDRGDFRAAVACYRRVLTITPEQSARGRPLDHAGARSNIVNGLNYDPEVTQERLLAEHVAWGRAHGDPPDLGLGRHANTPDRQRPLRIGYVSGDFRRHTVAYYFLPVLARHDRTSYEAYCYSTCALEDDLTRRIKELATRWRAVAEVGDRELVELIRADGIDILVDLSGHTAFNRLPIFAHRPAPVQASWLGYFNTTGLAAMDYALMDEYAVPPGGEKWFTEKLVRLPLGRFCYAPPEYAPPVSPPPCAARGLVTFGSFNNLTKVTDQVVELWSQVLRRVPGARLLLKWKTLADPAERRRFGQMFARHGVEPAQVELRGPSAHHAMLAEYGEVDIALDPFPFSGGVTSCEALWMGVPVITLPGLRPVSRQTLGFLAALEMTELVAGDPGEYVAMAVELAGDPRRLARLRSELRPRMAASPLCDAPRFTAALERTLRNMWMDWCHRQGR